MLKKGISLILTALSLMVLSTATFAGIQLNPIEPGDIELIAPKIGSERQVFVKDSMAISIRSVMADVSLFKVMPSAHNVFLDEACESEMVVAADAIPFSLVSGGNVFVKDSFIDSETDLDTEVLEMEDELEVEVTADSDEIIDGTQALLLIDKLSSQDRQDAIQSYNDARLVFEDKLALLEEAYNEYMAVFPEGHVAEYDYSAEEIEVIKAYLLAVSEVKDYCMTYQDAKEKYESIFEIPLFGPEDLSDVGILPYYQKTVEKISPGLYKFVFSDQDDNEVIEVIEFEVTKKEELTEKVIKEAMPSTAGELILPSVDLKNVIDFDPGSNTILEERNTTNEKNQLERPVEENTDE